MIISYQINSILYQWQQQQEQQLNLIFMLGSGALHSGTRLGENVGGNADTYIYLWQSMSFFRIIFEINNVKYVGYN